MEGERERERQREREREDRRGEQRGGRGKEERGRDRRATHTLSLSLSPSLSLSLSISFPLPLPLQRQAAVPPDVRGDRRGRISPRDDIFGGKSLEPTEQTEQREGGQEGGGDETENFACQACLCTLYQTDRANRR